MTEETPIRPTLEEQCRGLVGRMRDAKVEDDVTNGVVLYWANKLEAILDE